MKKNKKGFTLIEILAVLVVMSLIMIIAVPSIQKAMSNAKTGISSLNKKNLTEAGKTLATEIELCDSSDNETMKNIIAYMDFTDLSNHHILTSDYTDKAYSSCIIGKAYLTEGFKIQLKNLIALGYFDDTSKSCQKDYEKYLTIIANTSYEVTTNINNKYVISSTNASADNKTTVNINDITCKK